MFKLWASAKVRDKLVTEKKLQLLLIEKEVSSDGLTASTDTMLFYIKMSNTLTVFWVESNKSSLRLQPFPQHYLFPTSKKKKKKVRCWDLGQNQILTKRGWNLSEKNFILMEVQYLKPV